MMLAPLVLVRAALTRDERLRRELAAEGRRDHRVIRRQLRKLRRERPATATPPRTAAEAAFDAVVANRPR
jgi:hypothetical protein